jgi:hypothetical protein
MVWERHENNIYDKITHWFEAIGKVLQDPAILPENVYNMDETGVMLCMLGSIKVHISTDDPRDYRGAGVKRTMVTAIESPVHAPSFDCDDCDRSFDSEEALQQHLRDSPAHAPSFDCETCDRSFGNE